MQPGFCGKSIRRMMPTEMLSMQSSWPRRTIRLSLSTVYDWRLSPTRGQSRIVHLPRRMRSRSSLMSFDNQSNSPEPSQENPSTSGTDQSVDEILNQHIHEHDATLQVLSESEEA